MIYQDVSARYIPVVAGDGSSGRPLINVGGGRTFSIPAAQFGDFTLRLFGETRSVPDANAPAQEQAK